MAFGADVYHLVHNQLAQSLGNVIFVAKIRFSFESVCAAQGHFARFLREFLNFSPSLHNYIENVQPICSEICIFALLLLLLPYLCGGGKK